MHSLGKCSRSIQLRRPHTEFLLACASPTACNCCSKNDCFRQRGKGPQAVPTHVEASRRASPSRAWKLFKGGVEERGGASASAERFIPDAVEGTSRRDNAVTHAPSYSSTNQPVSMGWPTAPLPSMHHAAGMGHKVLRYRSDMALNSSSAWKVDLAQILSTFMLTCGTLAPKGRRGPYH